MKLSITVFVSLFGFLLANTSSAGPRHSDETADGFSRDVDNGPATKEQIETLVAGIKRHSDGKIIPKLPVELQGPFYDPESRSGKKLAQKFPQMKATLLFVGELRKENKIPLDLDVREADPLSPGLKIDFENETSQLPQFPFEDQLFISNKATKAEIEQLFKGLADAVKRESAKRKEVNALAKSLGDNPVVSYRKRLVGTSPNPNYEDIMNGLKLVQEIYKTDLPKGKIKDVEIVGDETTFDESRQLLKIGANDTRAAVLEVLKSIK